MNIQWKFRGGCFQSRVEPLDKKEKKRFNQLGQSILRGDGFVLEDDVDYDRMKLMDNLLTIFKKYNPSLRQ